MPNSVKRNMFCPNRLVAACQCIKLHEVVMVFTTLEMIGQELVTEPLVLLFDR